MLPEISGITPLQTDTTHLNPPPISILGISIFPLPFLYITAFESIIELDDIEKP